MALERINPFQREDRFCLDHLLRYNWAQLFIKEQTVVDVACGTGFGSAMLAEGGAKSVTGIDLDPDTIENCRSCWTHPNLKFEQSGIESLETIVADKCNRVICFETLEHVKDPAKALISIKSILQEDGLLIGSVPGEMDRLEENEFHLQHFSRNSVRKLLEGSFKNVILFEQNFHLASLINRIPGDYEKPISEEEMSGVRINFGRTSEWSDTYLFIASDVEFPEKTEPRFGVSRKAWTSHFEESIKAFQELNQTSEDYMKFYAMYNSLFVENGELQRRFENLLSWGNYHYEKSVGHEPEAHYLKSIEYAQSKREKLLYEQVLDLQQKNQDLKEQIKAMNSTE